MSCEQACSGDYGQVGDLGSGVEYVILRHAMVECRNNDVIVWLMTRMGSKSIIMYTKYNVL